jgi:hypothetical protein
LSETIQNARETFGLALGEYLVDRFPPHRDLNIVELEKPLRTCLERNTDKILAPIPQELNEEPVDTKHGFGIAEAPIIIDFSDHLGVFEPRRLEGFMIVVMQATMASP